MGMIRLGFDMTSIYPSNGIYWENRGNVVFNGSANIGNDCHISVGETGKLIIGEKFTCTCALRLTCYNNIVFDKNVLIGWECTITDTDFHSIYVDGKKTKGFGQINIGQGTWIAMKTLVLKNTILPPQTVVAARATLNRDYRIHGERILLSGSPAQVLKHNTFRDINNNKIDYTF